jgi:hypothetical protein
LRVVRVTADDGQRIVGVQIPSERVAAVLRALGVASTSREPDEIFNGVLFEGEEMELTSALRLRPGNIHGEPAIELCGADPSMFGVLRKLGLINEQINWKQRFFVPTEEEPGIAILAALLEQFPVIATEDEEADCHPPSAIVMPLANAQPVDLEDWIIEPLGADRSNGVAEPEPLDMTEGETESTRDDSEPACARPSQNACYPIARPATAPAWLPTQLADCRRATIQIGFNFAESES